MSAHNATASNRTSGPYVYPPFVGGLMGPEISWRNRYPYLMQKGYRLRPRYNPDWKPSWIGSPNFVTSCEDAQFATHHEGQIMDAIKVDDNRRVAIKEISRNSAELAISRMVSSKEFSCHPFNHCVEIFDVLDDCAFPDKSLLVMQFLHPCDDPPFDNVEEVMEFIRQTLEGLYFLHSHGIAHRDCWSTNIMMDAQPLYADGYHPINRRKTPDYTRSVKPSGRRGHPIKYYYIDFGLSSYFKDGEPPYVVGRKGACTVDIPEFDLPDGIQYNAFMLDIFMLGQMYVERLLKIYRGLDFLGPLVLAMTQEQSERRPTAESALQLFHDIQHQNTCTGPILHKDATPAEMVLHNAKVVTNYTFNMTRSFIGF